jgi:TolB-like protein/Tfp pilus assembly protein PilF
VKILDFGLAKLKGVSSLTKESSTLGTVHYMSPEQTMGKEVDHRADIWALGVLLYEMLTGELPFKGDYEQAVIYAILNECPPKLRSIRPEVPPELEKLVDHCLEKDPDKRYQQADEIIGDLRSVQQLISGTVSMSRQKPKRALWIGIGAVLLSTVILLYFFLPRRKTAVGEKSIAVLPFVDMSPQKDQEYFCDGMTEEIINRLANISRLKVPARTSAFAFKGKVDDVREIGRKLGVEHILEGSIKKEGNRLRITIQLINVADSFHVWSETFDRELTKVFSIQDEIALTVADKLKLSLLGEEKAKLEKRPTENLEAYTLYLQGRFFLDRGVLFIDKAIECFQQAIRLDPQYGLGYAGLAYAYTFMGEAGANPNEFIPKAREAALEALRIDGQLAEAHVAIAMIKLYYEWDWRDAEVEFLQAIRINPKYAGAYLDYSINLYVLKRFDEALEIARKGAELDPLSTLGTSAVGDVLKHMRRYDEAKEAFKKALAMDPGNDSTHWNLFLLSISMGQDEETQKEMEKLMEIGGFPGWHVNPKEMQEFKIVCREKGWRGGLAWNLDRMMRKEENERISPFLIAIFNTILGRKEAGIQWLEKAVEQRDMLMPFVNTDPIFDPLRKDPRFLEIIIKMGFEK